MARAARTARPGIGTSSTHARRAELAQCLDDDQRAATGAGPGHGQRFDGRQGAKPRRAPEWQARGEHAP